MKGSSYFKYRQGFAINEGGMPFNCCFLWAKPRMIYIYLYGYRFFKLWRG